METLMDNNKDKSRKTDRVLVIRPIPGRNSKTDKGITDNRLFQGENIVHAVMHPETCLWRIKYEKSMPPPVLNQAFTSFNKLMQFATGYFEKRGLRIESVID
jgi:hypothetical protein